MAKDKITGLLMGGSLKQSGVTFYLRNGRVVARTAHSNEKRSNTRAQFDARQRMKHTVALWQEMRLCDPMFEGGKSTYGRFSSLVNRLPVVYLPNRGEKSSASLLLPEMPMSDGTLPSIKEWLGKVGENGALLTDLKVGDLKRGDTLRLYTVVQSLTGNAPRVNISMRTVKKDELTEVDGQLALTGAEFLDPMRGWALVRISDGRCSTQTLVTNCNYYELYTTEKAMQEAVKTYGGLSK